MTATVQVTRVIEWDMAHRLGDGYKSKCRHLHGHRYKAHITIEAPQLDQFGMVLDFSAIKQVCGGWVDHILDHATMVCERDLSLHKLLVQDAQRFVVVPFNSTVENIVGWMARQFQALLDLHTDAETAAADPADAAKAVPPVYKLVKLRVYETPNGWAEWSCPAS